MKIPGFSAEASLTDSGRSYNDMATDFHYSTQMVKPALTVKRMPPGCYQYCQTEIIYEPCGSAREGEPVPMCPAGTRQECYWECPPPTFHR